jgi:hypothetical protein
MAESVLASLAMKIVFLLAVGLAIIIIILWSTGNMKILGDIITGLAKAFTRAR